MITGNKGEWSEIYALFKLLGDKQLFLGNKDIEKLEGIVYPILRVLRTENNGDFEYSIQDEILSMSPNPANGQVNIAYKATNASSAYIMITQPYGNTYNYIIDVTQSNININLTGYQTGAYYAVLVCNGLVVDSKALIIE